ncbi:MAG: CarD family transcriptional regulator [Blastocatellia bacterium]
MRYLRKINALGAHPRNGCVIIPFQLLYLFCEWRIDRVLFRSGSKVIYPRIGICKVESVIEQSIGGSPVRLYSLKPMIRESTILVPVNKAIEVGVRKLIDKEEIPKLLRFLGKDVEVSSDHRKRSARNAESIASGEIFRVADSLKAMTKLGRGKNLSPEEQQTMSRARQLLIDEISCVTRMSSEAVDEMIENALAGKRQRLKKVAA